MIGRYMHSSVGFGNYGNVEYGFGNQRKPSRPQGRLHGFGVTDADIAAAERDVQFSAEAHQQAIIAGTSPTGTCAPGVMLPALACDGRLATAIDDTARRLGEAGERLAKLQEQKGDAAAASKSRAARAESLLAAEEARTAKTAAAAAAARTSASTANRNVQSAAGGSWLQTAPIEQKLAAAGVIFGGLLVLVFAAKM